MLPDAKRVLFTTGDVEGVMVGSWENYGLTCLICVLGFFGLSNLHTRACFYGTQRCNFLISNRGIASFGTLVTFSMTIDRFHVGLWGCI
jgi:hypothetical protein